MIRKQSYSTQSDGRRPERSEVKQFVMPQEPSHVNWSEKYIYIHIVEGVHVVAWQQPNKALMTSDVDVRRRRQTSIDHSFISCQFTVSFAQKVLQWFNTTHNSAFNLNTEEFLFGLPNVSDVLQKKLNYTLLFLRYYIYKRKLQNDSLMISDFIKKVMYKYRIELYS